MDLRLSVLDQAPVAEGSTPVEALRNSIELARHVETLGYYRFWMSEHHAMELLACSAPEVVLAAVGAATRTIRLGSGGIMLPHYSPFKVAEVFRTLDTLYPGRIDLGVGRAPGGGPIESQALRRDRSAMPADDFPEQVAELQAWLGGGFPPGHPFGRVHLAPAPSSSGPDLWLLGSSLWGASAAAEWGLPYAYAHFFSPAHTRAALTLYRRNFKPSAALAKPYVALAVGVIAADTDEEARFLLGSVRLLQRRIREGDRRPVATPAAAQRELGQALDLEEGEFPRYVAGSPATVRRALAAMSGALAPDEILINTITHSHSARLRSYTLLAEAFAHTRAAALAS